MSLSTQLTSPPVPVPIVKSPPWIMKLGMILWNEDPLKCRGLPFTGPIPYLMYFNDVQNIDQFYAFTVNCSRFLGKILLSVCCLIDICSFFTFSPVHKHLKFSAVLGTVLPNSPITTRPASSPPTVTSKKTFNVQNNEKENKS